MIARNGSNGSYRIFLDLVCSLPPRYLQIARVTCTEYAKGAVRLLAKYHISYFMSLHFIRLSLHFIRLSLFISFGWLSLHFIRLSLHSIRLSLHFIRLSLHFTCYPVTSAKSQSSSAKPQSSCEEPQSSRTDVFLAQIMRHRKVVLSFHIPQAVYVYKGIRRLRDDFTDI